MCRTGGTGRTGGTVVAAWAAMVLVASAADVWETKPFTEWSDKEVEKLLIDSPWAGKASLTHAREGANLGLPDWKLMLKDMIFRGELSL